MTVGWAVNRPGPAVCRAISGGPVSAVAAPGPVPALKALGGGTFGGPRGGMRSVGGLEGARPPGGWSAAGRVARREVPAFDRDLLLGALTLYWTTRSITTSLLPYWAYRHRPDSTLPTSDPSAVPTAVSIFGGARVPFPKPPRELLPCHGLGGARPRRPLPRRGPARAARPDPAGRLPPTTTCPGRTAPPVGGRQPDHVPLTSVTQIPSRWPLAVGDQSPAQWLAKTTACSPLSSSSRSGRGVSPAATAVRWDPTLSWVV